MAMSAAVGIMAVMSQSRSRKATRIADRVRAQAIAEAGARYGYSVLATNFSGTTEAESDPFPLTPLDGGTFDVDVTLATTGVAVVRSIGRYRNAEREVILDIGSEGAPGTTNDPPPDAAYDYAVLANQIDWSGGVSIQGGWIHANTTFLLGGASSLQGDISACSWIRINGNGWIIGDTKAPQYKKKAPAQIYGSVYTGPVQEVPIPSIDFVPYYTWALDNGEVYSGTKEIKNTTYTPNGGVLWVEGILKTSQATINGCFIATDYVEIKAHTDHHKLDDLPAFMCVNGDITVRSGSSTEGLLYAKAGGIDIAGNGGGASIHGSVVCAGLFKFRGGYNLFTYTNSMPQPPGDDDSEPGTDYVYLNAWQK